MDTKSIRPRTLVAIAIAAALTVALTLNFFQVYTCMFWGAQILSAERTTQSERAHAGDSAGAVVAELGPPKYEAPGFTIGGRVKAAVQVWTLADGRELRVLVVRDRVVAAREGAWRLP